MFTTLAYETTSSHLQDGVGSLESVVTKYIVISPVKDEEKYVETTIKAVVGQTLRPYRWVIVNDGSTDGTAGIIEEYARKFDWIRPLTRHHNAPRQPGGAVIRAFNDGLESVVGEPTDFIVKMDCDIELPPGYFESLLGKFEADPTLGIASGVYLEESGSNWMAVEMPSYHAAGACKVVRADCFGQIGGFVESRGWDTVDEIKAQVLGWKTRHFEELKFRHLKKEGSSIGAIATSVMHGEVFYLTGGGILFFAMKVLHRMVFDKPVLLSGLALLCGYLKLVLRGEQKLVSRTEGRLYSRLLRRRLWRGLSSASRKGMVNPPQVRSCE